MCFLLNKQQVFSIWRFILKACFAAHAFVQYPQLQTKIVNLLFTVLSQVNLCNRYGKELSHLPYLLELLTVLPEEVGCYCY